MLQSLVVDNRISVKENLCPGLDIEYQ